VRCPALNRIWSSSTISLAAVPEPDPQSVHGAAGVPHYDDRVGIVSFGYEHPRGIIIPPTWLVVGGA
jgi:hypothetical protein